MIEADVDALFFYGGVGFLEGLSLPRSPMLPMLSSPSSKTAFSRKCPLLPQSFPAPFLVPPFCFHPACRLRCPEKTVFFFLHLSRTRSAHRPSSTLRFRIISFTQSLCTPPGFWHFIAPQVELRGRYILFPRPLVFFPESYIVSGPLANVSPPPLSFFLPPPFLFVEGSRPRHILCSI